MPAGIMFALSIFTFGMKSDFTDVLKSNDCLIELHARTVFVYAVQNSFCTLLGMIRQVISYCYSGRDREVMREVSLFGADIGGGENCSDGTNGVAWVSARPFG